MGITVREPSPRGKPGADNSPGSARGKRQRAAHQTLQDRKAEGTPRNRRVFRTLTTLNPSDSIIHVCTACESENWKWLTECPKCGHPVES